MRGRLWPPPSRAAEIEVGHLRIREERVAGPLEAVLAALEHVAAVGEAERATRVLLDHHDRDARPVDVGDGLIGSRIGVGRQVAQSIDDGIVQVQAAMDRP